MMGKSPLVYLFEQEVQEYVDQKAEEMGHELTGYYKNMNFRISLEVHYKTVDEKNGRERKG